MPKVKIVGVEKLQKKLRKNVDMEEVKKVVRHNGAEMQAKVQRNAPIDTGNLRRSVGLEIRDNGLTAESEATAEYAGYVEYGTRYMKAQPYMRPAFEEQKDKTPGICYEHRGRDVKVTLWQYQTRKPYYSASKSL